MKSFFNQCFLCFGLVLFTASFAFGQDDTIDAAGSSNQGSLGKHFTSKANPSFTIRLDGLALGETFQWGYCVGSTSCGGSFTSIDASGVDDVDVPGTESSGTPDNLNANFNGRDITISFPGAVPPGVDLYILRLRATITNASGPRTVDKRYNLRVRDPLLMSFVVDRSGSMECIPNSPIATADWTACANIGSNNSKWNQVKAGINTFFTPLTSDANKQVSGDAISIVYFDGDTILLDPSVGTPLVDDDPTGAPPRSVDMSVFTAGIASDFDNFAAAPGAGRNGTALGPSLEYAIDKKHQGSANLTDFRQIMIVITDGQENVAPRVDAAAALTLEDGTSLLNDESATNYIEYFCLGLDADDLSGSYGDKLQKLSTGDGANTHFIHVDGTTNVTAAINHLITSIYAGYSPQIIDEKRLLMAGDSAVHTFPVNDGGEVLYFSAGFEKHEAQWFSYKLEKNGLPYNSFLKAGHPQFTGNSALLQVDIDRLHAAGDSIEGDWKLTVSRQVVDIYSSNQQQINIPEVTLSCITDDEWVDLTYGLGKEQFEVGDLLEPEVQLTIDGVGIEDATITATINKPGEDKGDLVAKGDAPHTPELGSEINNPFSVKYGNIRNTDPNYLAGLAIQNNQITLTHRGHGLYRGSFDQLDVADNYGVVFRIEAEHPSLGKIVRYRRLSTAVRFGTLIHNLAEQEIVTTKGDDYRHVLTYTPVHKVNDKVLLVGPGYADAFSLEASEGTRLTDVIDNGDGSYTLRVNSNQRNPKTDFRLLDEPFYTDRGIQGFDDPYLPYTSHLSAHAGLTIPGDSLSSLYDASFFAELDFGILVLPRLEAEAILGLYSFAPDFSVVGGSINARYNLLQLGSASSTGVTASIGAGLYRPKSSDTTFGFNARLGIQRQINSKLSISLESTYFRLPTPSMSWNTAGIALRWGL